MFVCCFKPTEEVVGWIDFDTIFGRFQEDPSLSEFDDDDVVESFFFLTDFDDAFDNFCGELLEETVVIFERFAFSSEESDDDDGEAERFFPTNKEKSDDFGVGEVIFETTFWCFDESSLSESSSDDEGFFSANTKQTQN